jgi:hypothetical protein
MPAIEMIGMWGQEQMQQQGMAIMQDTEGENV